MTEFKPKIVGFLCNWCAYAGADLAGVSRIQYPSNLRIVRVMCSGRVDPVFILEAFRSGADGVLIGGCHPGDCHYQTGNYQTIKRVSLLKQMMKELGINDKRLRLEWISASEGRRFAQVIDEFTEEVRKFGKLETET